MGISLGSTMICLDGGELYEPLTIPHNGYVFGSKTKTGSNSGPEGQGLGSSIRATRKERRCFAAECGFGGRLRRDFIRATRKERRCFAAEKAPTPLGTHEHSRVRLIRAARCPGLGSSSSASPFRDVQIKAGLCHVKVFS